MGYTVTIGLSFAVTGAGISPESLAMVLEKEISL